MFGFLLPSGGEYIPDTNSKKIRQHPACLHIEAMLHHVENTVKSDPDLDCLRIRNLLQDLLDLDLDVFLWSVDADTKDQELPEELSTRLSDVVATCKRVGLYID